MATYKPNILYKVSGNNSPFTVKLSGATGIVCQQTVPASGVTTTIALNAGDYTNNYNLIITNSTGYKQTKSFTICNPPTSLSICSPSYITPPSNAFCETGVLCIQPAITNTYTGYTNVCLCNNVYWNSIPPEGSVVGTSCTRLYCSTNGTGPTTLICTNYSTGGDISKIVNIPINHNDIITYDVCSWVGANINASAACLFLVSVPYAGIDYNCRANLAIDSHHYCRGVMVASFSPVTKTIELDKTSSGEISSGICYSTGIIPLSPTLEKLESLNLTLTACTTASGTNANSCAVFYCKANNAPYFVQNCLVDNSLAAHTISLSYYYGDTFCYCLGGQANTYGSSSRSSIGITNAVGNMGSIVPAISTTKRDSISFSCIEPIKHVCFTLDTDTGTNPEIITGTLTTTPSMLVGQSYSATLCMNVTSVIFGNPACLTNSAACVCVACNGIQVGVLNISGYQSLIGSSFNLNNVVSTDSITYQSCACMATSGGANGITCGELYIATITPISGSFSIATPNVHRSACIQL